MIISYDKPLPKILNKTQAIHPPSIQIMHNHNLYTLIMYDLDAKYTLVYN